MRGVLLGLTILYLLGGAMNAGAYAMHLWSLGWPPVSVAHSALAHGAIWPADLVQSLTTLL